MVIFHGMSWWFNWEYHEKIIPIGNDEINISMMPLLMTSLRTGTRPISRCIVFKRWFSTAIDCWLYRILLEGAVHVSPIVHIHMTGSPQKTENQMMILRELWNWGCIPRPLGRVTAHHPKYMVFCIGKTQLALWSGSQTIPMIKTYMQKFSIVHELLLWCYG